MKKPYRSLLVLVLASFGFGAPLAVAGAENIRPLSPTILGNPTISSVSGPAPVGSVGASVPTQVPKGPTPTTHVYVKAGGGNDATFAAMEFHVPVGLQRPTMTLRVEDDASPAEDVNAATAPLYACVMPTEMFAGDPDAAVNFDCTLPGKGVRTANAVGGSWTFDVSALASTVDHGGRFGLAIVSAPDPAAAFSVAVLRSGVSLTVVGASAAGTVGTAQPAAPGAGVASIPAGNRLPPTGVAGVGLAVPPLSLTGSATPEAPRPDVASALGGALATPTQFVPTASARGTATHWRPLLLLLVPIVPVAGLAVLRRLDPDGDDPEALAELYPGLASLRS